VVHDDLVRGCLTFFNALFFGVYHQMSAVFRVATCFQRDADGFFITTAGCSQTDLFQNNLFV